MSSIDMKEAKAGSSGVVDEAASVEAERTLQRPSLSRGAPETVSRPCGSG